MGEGLVTPLAITEFKGDYGFLSNFYPAEVWLDGRDYPSVEHAFQAAKTLDLNIRTDIKSLTAGSAKRAGRTVRLRPDWEDIKLPIMENLVRQKFQSHAKLGRSLLDTHDRALVEGNWWGDTFWGVHKGKGENHLGKILMKVRDELK
ncbi:hypothetical protein LCGC14_2553590 [marine sediment metagenome]|uniref:NADAR domain-containing protein n=1 Tax=marine sediment metagenome TaxID=412755 RepID=A0A0F9AM33_9ZZZZ